jgi:hypothetical protein
LHYHIKQLRKTHPEVDIILVEPSRNDYQMFFYNRQGRPREKALLSQRTTQSHSGGVGASRVIARHSAQFAWAGA